MKILIVEDDQKIASFLRDGLLEEGYEVIHCVNGESSVPLILSGEAGLVVLDIVLPGKSGLDVCREIRAAGSGVPVLMLTARDSIDNKIEGLDSGADDYLTKPFNFEEMLSRIRALQRRSNAFSGTVLKARDLEYNPSTGTVTRMGRQITLSGKQYALLEYFMRRKGRIITEAALLADLWHNEQEVESNIIKVYIHHLRQKIDKDFPLQLIKTIKGIGYKLDA